jgi:hypothetical protein
MLQNLSDEVRECLQRAEQSAQRAKGEPNPAIKRDFLDMKRRWLKLARSYQFLDQLGSFTTHNKQKQAELWRRLAQLNQLLKDSDP